MKRFSCEAGLSDAPLSALSGKPRVRGISPRLETSFFPAKTSHKVYRFIMDIQGEVGYNNTVR